VEDKNLQKDVIDGVVAELKANGPFATRDDLHTEIMDAMKSVTITPDPGANGELTPRQEASAKAAWYSQVLGYGRPWDGKSWTTDVSGAASQLVPSIVANSIYQKLNNTPFRKAVTQYPYSPKGTILSQLVLAQAHRMTVRGTAVAEAVPTLDPIEYNTAGLMAWMGLDNKLIKEAGPSTVTYIEDELVRAIYRQEMYEWTLGVHAGNLEMTGMFSRATAVDMVVGHDTLAEITREDLIKLFWSPDVGYADNAVLIAPSSVLAKLATLNDPLVAGGMNYLDIPTMKFMGGINVIRMPESSFNTVADGKVAAYYGDPKLYYLFADGPITVATTNEGKTALTEDQTFIAAKVYTDGNLIQPLGMYALKYNTA